MTHQNRNEVQLHGCIVCAKIHTLLVVYTPDGKLIGCSVTSPGGHCVPDERRPLAACDTHTGEEIEAAYQRWLARDEINRAEEDE